MKYRKKPVVVEAIQFTGTNYEKNQRVYWSKYLMFDFEYCNPHS
ncbi:phage protein [Streptococcus pyogenes]|nr:phage protein [Streptococcus pyogenes]